MQGWIEHTFWTTMRLPSGKDVRITAFTLRGLAMMVATMRDMHGAVCSVPTMGKET